jgi:hypothetical protein
MPTRRTLLQIAAGGIAAIVVGALGPWATILGFSVAGTEGDGTYALVLALVAGLALWRAWSTASKGMLIACAALGALVLIIGIYDYDHISSASEAADVSEDADLESSLAAGFAGLVSIGWGLYVVILGAIATIAGALGAWQVQDRAGQSATLGSSSDGLDESNTPLE